LNETSGKYLRELRSEPTPPREKGGKGGDRLKGEVHGGKNVEINVSLGKSVTRRGMGQEGEDSSACLHQDQKTERKGTQGPNR